LKIKNSRLSNKSRINHDDEEDEEDVLYEHNNRQSQSNISNTKVNKKTSSNSIV
jgi:hypothetical protein